MIGIKVSIISGSNYKSNEETAGKIPFYEPEKSGVTRSHRKLGGYAWKDKDGTVVIERSDGKRIRLTLP